MVEQEKDWEKENARLAAELKDSQRTVERLEAEREAAGRSMLGLGRIASWVVMGPSLAGSFERWLEAKSISDPMPPRETARVWAAVVRRVFAVGVVGLIVAAVPIGLLAWQNFLIKAQNEFFQEQIGQTQEQLQRDRDDTYRIRKAELLQIIYGKKEGCEEDEEAAAVVNERLLPWQRPTSGKCLIVRERRIRNQAIRAFVEIENGRKESIKHSQNSHTYLFSIIGNRLNLASANLGEANLSFANLSFADLSFADLLSANLSGASLNFADLISANLKDAYFTNADLTRADLTRADLTNADLSGTNLSGANLKDANLRNAYLSGADLSTAKNLPALSPTLGNFETKIPPNTPRPEHWGKPVAEQVAIIGALLRERRGD